MNIGEEESTIHIEPIEDPVPSKKEDAPATPVEAPPAPAPKEPVPA